MVQRRLPSPRFHPAPEIVTVAEFEAVQRSLKARSPKIMPPRAGGGSTLLTGICFCACCGAMTLRTGTSRSGQEYRYYTCATKATKGENGMPRRLALDDRLNEAVIEHLEKRLIARPAPGCR